VTDQETQSAIRAVWSIESAKLIAGITRITRDLAVAEELAQDALLAALEQWPESGVPDNPGAWLMATAKNRAINHLRRGKLLERKHEELGHELAARSDERRAATDPDVVFDEDVGDDVLRLVFIACHPVLSTEARVTLTLRLLGGLTTAEIARAFIVSEATIAQRIVRAKRTLSDAAVPFELPPRAELSTRLASVLEVVYLIFNEGYAATAGDDVMRPALCEDALRLGRMLAQLAPDEPEAHGLLALMELHASRAVARVGPGGEPILLLEQNRARWDQGAIQRGIAALLRSGALADAPGRYALQAAISACHARARTAPDTDWARIAELYRVLGELTPSPIVALNRAVAVGMAEGPAAGLELIDALASHPLLQGYHLLPSARGDLLAKLGRLDEARTELQRAAGLARNARDRDLLLQRAAQCGRSTP
jgi:RNA polymerase sigma-70 factor (ECF subfamily)